MKKKKAREWWLCEYCWQVWSKKRSAMLRHHGPHDGLKINWDAKYPNPIKVIEVLVPKKRRKS